MPVAKTAVEKYLSRQLEPLTWFKELAPADIEHDLKFVRPAIVPRAPLRSDQKAVLLAALSNQDLVVLSDLGWGKGHPVGTKILTPSGWSAVETIKVGDKVIGSNGKPVSVTGVYDRGVLPTFTVKFNDGAAVDTDGDHLWAVCKYRDKKAGTQRVLSTRELKESLKTGWRHWSIPMVKPVEFTSRGSHPLPISPYILGVLLADGHLTSSGSVAFTPGDELVPAEVSLELPEDLFVERRSGSRDRAAVWRIRSRTRGCSSIKIALKLLGLYGLKSQHRFIPTDYLMSSPDDRLNLLRGLMDTDGHLSSAKNQTVTFYSSSKQLADDVSFIVESLGGSVRRWTKHKSYSYKGEKKAGLPSYDVRINLPKGVCPVRAFAHKWRPRVKYLPNRIVSEIADAADRQVYCLAVDAKDQLYVTEHCIVTHNTALSLELLQYYYDNRFVRRAFVFAPTDEVCEGWEDEINKWGFTVPHIRLSGSSRDKWEQLQGFGNGVIIGTYIGIAAMVSKLVPVTGKDKRERQIVSRLILGLVHDVDAVVYDQSTKLGNTNSLSFQVCKEFSIEAQLRYSLAGRAFGRDPFVLWSQFFLTDRGRALGRSAGMFREAFWYRTRSPWGTKWKIRKRREPLLADLISASSLRYAIEECVELPPKVSVKKECVFPDDNWTYYDEIREEMIAARGNYREIQNSFLRMRQISSGFVGFRDDETGERAQIEFEQNPKLDLLMELVDEVPEDRKLLVFYEFTWSGARICQELSRQKRKFGWLWAGTKNWTSIKDQFNNDPDYRILVVNWKKGGMGLNLQAASYLFFFESPVSGVDRYESEGRIYRTGQKHKSMIYDLVVKDSADDKILEFHAESRDLFRSLVENPAKILGGRR